MTPNKKRINGLAALYETNDAEKLIALMRQDIKTIKKITTSKDDDDVTHAELGYARIGNDRWNR